MTSNETSRIAVSPLTSAADSLTRAAKELEALTQGDALAIKGVLGWGWHAVGLLAYARLQPVKDTFDAWLRDYFAEGEPVIDIERDTLWLERSQLGYLALLDLLSEVELPLLRPEFFQGWQDRTSRCRALREQITELIGTSISGEDREKLVLLLAAHRRLLRLSSPVEIDLEALITALSSLFILVEHVLDQQSPDASQVNAALELCKSKIK